MGNFNYIATLDQVRGYCAMSLIREDQQCVRIATPWVAHVCNKLLQGTKNAVEFHQREIVKLNEGLDCVKAFLDDAVILGKGNFAQHLEELDEVLTRMEETGL